MPYNDVLSDPAVNAQLEKILRALNGARCAGRAIWMINLARKDFDEMQVPVWMRDDLSDNMIQGLADAVACCADQGESLADGLAVIAAERGPRIRQAS